MADEREMTDTERLDFILSCVVVLTLPIHDGSVGEDFRPRTREELDAQIARCADYAMWSPGR